MRVVAYVGDRNCPIACKIDIRMSGDYDLAIDPEYGEPILLEYSRMDDALILYFVDIAGERHKFMLASVS